MEKLKTMVKGFSFGTILFLLYFLLPGLLALLFKKFLLSSNFWIHNVSYLTIYCVTFFLIFFLVKKDILSQFQVFLKQRKQILSKGLSYWIYGLIVMLLSNLVITSIVGNIPVNEQLTRETLFTTPLSSIPIIMFIGPFLEELVFRYGFRKPFQKEISYALFCAFLFGILHIITSIDEWTISNLFTRLVLEGELLFLVPYGSLGFFFAKAYYETENIFSSVIPHMLHNSLSVLLILLTHFLQY